MVNRTDVCSVYAAIIPLGRILIGAFEDGAGGFVEGIMRPEAPHALMMTGLVVLAVTLLNTLFGIMMAIYLVRAGWLSDRVKGLLNSIVDLPYAVSPVIGGLMIVLPPDQTASWEVFLKVSDLMWSMLSRAWSLPRYSLHSR